MNSDSEDDFQKSASEDDFQDSGSESDDYVPLSSKKVKLNDGSSSTKPTPLKRVNKTAATKKVTDKKATEKKVTEKKVTEKKTEPKKVAKKSGSIADYMNSPTSPKPKAIKKTTVTKKKEVDVNESDNDVIMLDAPPASTTKSDTTASTSKSIASSEKDKTVEEIYQKKTQLEHILLRPDTYIGSIEAEEQEMWIFDSNDNMIKRKKIKYVPGLYKIVDEILVNAADNKVRDPSMDTISVYIDRQENFISIENNGRGIPITEHKEENCYVPELIFGHLLTSSNYNDDEKKVTGGRNGYGAKLCNIFSTEFTVETGDKERKLKYSQTFKKNMSVTGKPKITQNARGAEYTRISFKPDLAKFGMTEMDEDFEALIKKRVYDLAGCVEGINVKLNGTRIPVKGFNKYCELYTKSMEIRNAEGKKPIISDPEKNERWQVNFAVSDGQFNQVSFVNSICTAKGGTHVNYIADQIVKALLPDVQKKTNNKNIRPFQIKNHMALFVNCQIENPAFDSQTKENMTLRSSKFGSTYKVSDKFLNLISKSGIVDNIVKWVKFKEDEQMTKADSSSSMARRLKIPKLEDANLAGVRPHNKDCTLILTEGDSAKALVLSGLSVVGRDKFGVFPLRGKLLNVRDATNVQIMNNAEITNVKAILGLKHGKTYSNANELRYGKLMIMTDQDHDGSHIKGLLINFIDSMFPSLLDIPGFLLEFITPIIRCRHKRNKREVTFFTIPEYETWALENNQNSEWEPKYFKGLGTSDKADARRYFSDLATHKKEFEIASPEERQLVDMAFNKKRAADRKEWLATYEPGIFIDHNVSKIKISDFVNRELMLFSMADNIRSIPSVVDGFKPGQRKVFYGTVTRATNSEIKVAQLATYVAGKTQYHHGEAGIAATIINMAQDYVGSNNINLLVPCGQFGTRHDGGKSAASPRYLFTKSSKIARTIYHPDDDDILDLLIEENKPIEPNWYIPIIPMVLVNGADGIGTGWSTSIPNYNPMDLVENLKLLMDGQEVKPLVPWYRGYKGEIVATGDRTKFISNGIVDVTDDSQIKITELPIRLWTDTFKENLDVMRDPKDKKPDINIIDFTNNSTDMAVEITIELDQTNLTKAENLGLLKALKLTSNINTTNFVCFDKDGKIKKYTSAEQILIEFYELRLDYYRQRKEHLIATLTDEYARLDNKAKFLQLVIDGKLLYLNRKEELVIADMKKHDLKPMYPLKKKSALIVEDDKEKDDGDNGYEYLFSINVRGFTEQKVKDLIKKKNEKYAQLQDIKSTEPKTFWRRDLDALATQWLAMLKEDEALMEQAKPIAPGSAKKRKRVMKPKVPKNTDDD